MPERLSNPLPASSSVRRHLHGFTLTEMVVAIGAVALLTIGIGQIFQSIGSLVGSGSALAQTDQAARAIEAQLRKDFDSLGRLRQEDTFFAIRCRTLKDVYIDRDDRDDDRRAGLLPGDPASLVVDTRLDEIMFLAFGGGENGEYPTSQITSPSNDYTPPRASTARIYYGHGLRPAPDLDFDPALPSSQGNTRQRQWLPDGDFGQPRGVSNRFDSGERVTGRNEFAGSWLLLRQQLVMAGSLLAGPVSTGATVPKPAFDPDLTYAPYPRAQDVLLHPNQFTTTIAQGQPDKWPGNSGGFRKDLPKARFLPFGRTDLCAMNVDELRRWLEGASPQAPFVDASPYDGGLFDVRSIQTGGLDVTDRAVADSVLWKRLSTLTHATPNPENLRLYQSAIAGMFTRFQAESSPPMIDRRDSLTIGSSSAGVKPLGDDPETALMDLHATFATHCSSFEIAWSDGTTWLGNKPIEIDTDKDGTPDIVFDTGDIIWYDINFPRWDQTNVQVDYEDFARQNPIAQNTVPRPGQGYRDGVSNPEITWNERDGKADRLEKRPDEFGTYAVAPKDRQVLLTGAVADGDKRSSEYLAIWGFHKLKADNSGEYERSGWIKPKLVRIRVTLHDDQFRVQGGRTYEFVFCVDLKE